MIFRLLIGAFIAGIILLECFAAYLLIPSAQEVSARAEAAVKEQIAAEKDADKKSDSDAITREFDLGKFRVSRFQPASNTTINVDFHLWATIKEDDFKEFETRFASSQHRFREQVIVITRNADVPELTDPGLALIKRQILEKTSTVIGKSLVQSIIFSDFSYVEQ
jgi:flagellar FliL protein